MIAPLSSSFSSSPVMTVLTVAQLASDSCRRRVLRKSFSSSAGTFSASTSKSPPPCNHGSISRGLYGDERRARWAAAKAKGNRLTVSPHASTATLRLFAETARVPVAAAAALRSSWCYFSTWLQRKSWPAVVVSSPSIWSAALLPE